MACLIFTLFSFPIPRPSLCLLHPYLHPSFDRLRVLTLTLLAGRKWQKKVRVRVRGSVVNHGQKSIAGMGDSDAM